jgi:hypothetical protein
MPPVPQQLMRPDDISTTPRCEDAEAISKAVQQPVGATRTEASTSEDARFTWLILRFILVMVPLVFVINGVTKGNWGEAFLRHRRGRGPDT